MDDGSSPVYGLVIFLVLLLINAIFYGFGSAIQALNENKVAKRLEEGNKQAKQLHKMMVNPTNLIQTIQIVVSFVGIIAGFYQVHIVVGVIQKQEMEWMKQSFATPLIIVVVSIVSVFLLVTLGVFVPKRIALKNAEKWAFALVGFVNFATILLRPFTVVITFTSNVILRILGIDPHESLDDVTEEEIISMVNEGHEQGLLLASEAEMIHNIFELGDKEAKDIMTHRKNIVGLDANVDFVKSFSYMLEENNSRFPVYEDDIDNIVGVVHIRDAMLAFQNTQYHHWSLKDVPKLVREISFIPETRNIDVLFKGMQFNKEHMVIVIDEYGQTAGLVAMEDILEEIVGNILDEYDEDETFIVKQLDGSFMIRGMAPLEDVFEALQLEDEDEEFETLNGFLISKIDKIPGDNEVFEINYQDFVFSVLFVENKTIQMVKVVKTPQVLTDADGKITCHNEETVLE